MLGFGLLALVILAAVWLSRQTSLGYKANYYPPTPPDPMGLEKKRQDRLLRERARHEIAARNRFREDYPFHKSHSPIDPLTLTCLTCGLTMGKIYLDALYCSGKWGEPGLTLSSLWLKMREEAINEVPKD